MSARMERAPSLFQKKKVFTEIETAFRPKFKRFFRLKLCDLQEKKRSSPKLRLLFRPQSEFQTFFPPKIRWFPKKKKRSSPKLRLIFRPKSEIQTFQGGLFSIFLKKSRSKPPKTCDFAYFISQWGAQAPPGYATVLLAFLWR